MTLWKACALGRSKHVEKLLEESASAPAQSSSSSSSAPASASASSSQPLGSSVSYADSAEPDSGLTPLILASRGGHVKVAQVLCNKGKATVNLKSVGGLTVR